VEGMAIAPVSDRSRTHLRRVAAFGVPFVLIDRTIPGVQADAIVGDNIGGARELVGPLLPPGHPRVGRLGEGARVASARDRRAGYVEALQRAGIEPDERLVVRASADADGGRVGMEALLALDERPTAVFTVNNLVALGAIEAARSAALDVPDDVALVCFDDIEYASRLYPFLTVMAQPAETLGSLGTELLLQRVDRRTAGDHRPVVPP